MLPARNQKRAPFSALQFALVAVAALGQALGCTSTQGQCERVCDWEQRCVQNAVTREDCSQQCVVAAEHRSEDCQDAFDEFATCAADNQSCPGVDKQCRTEADRLIEKCDCTNPRGPLVELCRQ